MALPNDMSRIVGALGRAETSSAQYTTTAKRAARNLVRAVYHIATVAAAANGSTDTVSNATTAWYARANGRVLAAYFQPTADATAEATNYVTIALHRLTGAGGAGTAVATTDTRPVANSGYGNITKATTVTLTLDGPNANFTRGQLLAPHIDQVAAGVALSAGTMIFEVEYEGVDAHGV